MITSIPQRLVGEALIRSATKNPSKTALIHKDNEYSYNFILTKSLRLASHFQKEGLQRGDRVAVYMNNSWEGAVSIFAASIAGGVFIVINPQTKPDKLNFILSDSGAKFIICDDILLNNVDQVISKQNEQIRIIVSGNKIAGDTGTKTDHSSLTDIFKSNQKPEIASELIPLDLAALIYTSGSTGFPKGVMITHQSSVFVTWSLIQYLRLTSDDIIMLVLPLAFDYGLYQLLMAITVGATLIIEQSFIFPATVYRQIEKWKPTVFPGVPTIYAMMIESYKSSGQQFRSIKKITNTAAALLPEMIPGLKNVFPEALIFKMYGLTECKRVSYLEPELLDSKIDTVGKAIPGTEVFLLTQDGRKAQPGEAGILHVRGPHVMSGYWNNKDLTNEMLVDGDIPGERVLCTHDLFRTDNDGFLCFLGRTDDIIKTRGEKVSPVEVENALLKAPGIKEAAVIGIPDEIMGEAIIGFVSCYNETKPEEKLIIQECMKHLETFMIPRRIICLDNMPKSTNGKIDKKILKEKYL